MSDTIGCVECSHAFWADRELRAELNTISRSEGLDVALRILDDRFADAHASHSSLLGEHLPLDARIQEVS